MLRRPLATLIVAMAVAACTSPREALIARGFPPAYAEGYDDGCASGNEAGGGLFAEGRKDGSRYTSDGQYAKGWDDGFAECKANTEAMVRDARLRRPSGED
jgi:hypothetical protein